MATRGTGVVSLAYGVRHNGADPADDVLFSLLGDPGTDSEFQVWSLTGRTDPVTNVTRNFWRKEETDNLTDDDRRFGLDGGLPVGQTCPRVGPTIGQPDVDAFWQERLDASGAWMCETPAHKYR